MIWKKNEKFPMDPLSAAALKLWRRLDPEAWGMPARPESLDGSAQLLGYDTEAQMLTDLYLNHKHSILDLAKRFGYSESNMRVRLLRAGIALRPKGGWNRREQVPGAPSEHAKTSSYMQGKKEEG